MKFFDRFAVTCLLSFSTLHTVNARPQAVDVLHKRATTTSSSTSYPTPTVPIGAGGGAFATVQGRLFQIQSKTQYFAGKSVFSSLRNFNVD